MGQGVVEVLKAANMLDKIRISSWIVPGTWDAEYLKMMMWNMQSM